jgi:FAD/FMN-containing dehydrogenase
VAWIDSTARGASLGRGHFTQGNHATEAPAEARFPKDERIPFPVDAPGFAINPMSVRAFNALYSRKQLATRRRSLMHWDPFFYPLDAIANWNRGYGKRGFYQYQCVLPFQDGHDALVEMMEESASANQASFLTVLKTFGSMHSPGLLSFPKPGVTLAIDYPNRGAKTLDLLERLDAITRKAGGRVYPAKDGRMGRESFQAYYPHWKELEKYRDPAFSSSFWRRVTG